MNLTKYRCAGAARSSIRLAAILGTALLTACVKPWGSFSLPLGASPKDLLSVSRLLSYSTPWELTTASKLNLVPLVSGMLVVGLIAGFSIPRQRMSLRVTAIVGRAKPDDGTDTHDDLLVKAGLRGLLGNDEGRLAQELENARRLADESKRTIEELEKRMGEVSAESKRTMEELEKRMGEVSAESKRTMEELEKSRGRGVQLETERDAMKRDLKEMTVELEGIRNNCERAVQQNAKTTEDLAESRAQVLEIKAERDALKEDQTRLNKELLQSQQARKILMDELLAARVSVSSLTSGLTEIKELVASGDAGGLESASLNQDPE